MKVSIGLVFCGFILLAIGCGQQHQVEHKKDTIAPKAPTLIIK